MIQKEVPKYQYHLQTWGGFYNDEHQKIHGFKEGDFSFNTAEARQKYANQLRDIEEKLNARHLALNPTEGFACDIRTVAHRVCEFKGERVYTTNDFSVNYPYDAAAYYIEYKWYPGFNDYPFGEDFDYSHKGFKIVQVWITGAFTIPQ